MAVGAAKAASVPKVGSGKARAMLLDARVIEARDEASQQWRFSYYFQVLKVETLRRVGAGYAVSARIGLLQDLPAEWYGGAFDEPPVRAWFCMRPSRVSWRLTGFDVYSPFFGGAGVRDRVCSSSGKVLARSGGPVR